MDVIQNYKDWLSLTFAKGIGSSICNRLLIEFNNPQTILACDSSKLVRFGLNEVSIKSLLNPDEEKINKILDWLNKPNRHLITILDSDYPELLKSIHSAPPILFAIGQREALGYIHFAIVGSRNPTTGGKRLAEEFAAELSKAGLTVCSGLALGIDYHSHLGALKVNCSTVAVLGNGLNSVYPARHKKIASQIIEEGLLISEYPPDTKPNPGNFPQRNRIISGMSTGVLVVEAAKKSGSLITANYALEQGRDVFALPGSIHNPLARGTHSLIKQGAKLVETVNDILEELAPVASIVLNKSSYIDSDKQDYDNLEEDYKLLLDSMGYDSVSVDNLVILTGLTAEAVSSMLLILELQGMIESQQGGRYCRCS
ncbi:MAG: DNA-protecting protein DprA [Proteobacteria bacterium]|nr:DNA-protecting protein DprA [Pseudomonadota bacterium]NOG60231.1 DNA-protecting protein DprA [Pseudomonadota bacterium]